MVFGSYLRGNDARSAVRAGLAGLLANPELDGELTQQADAVDSQLSCEMIVRLYLFFKFSSSPLEIADVYQF